MGTRRPTKPGYVLLKTERGWVLEHIHVMEQRLGRSLFPEEKVHHVDRDKTNNAVGNLELWITGHPAGQRVEDLLDWAAEHYPEELWQRLVRWKASQA